jgi:hypothetical protein
MISEDDLTGCHGDPATNDVVAGMGVQLLQIGDLLRGTEDTAASNPY